MDLDENLFNLWRRAVIKSRGPGTSPGYHECGSRLLLLENRRNLEPKETPKCSIPRLFFVFTRQLEILATTLLMTLFLMKHVQKLLKLYVFAV